MITIQIDPTLPTGQTITASHVDLSLPQPPKRFFRHGWQSWTLTTWIDPTDLPLPIRSPQFRAKDEDPLYAFSRNHIGAWVGAVELDDDDILLIGALGLGGRVELNGTSLIGSYEFGEGTWFIGRGPEDEVFQNYANLLALKFGKTRYEKPPRVWCSWYSLYKWINEHIILNALSSLGDLPFDVFQLDDGWQITHGDWEPTRKFPSGMSDLALRISATGRTAGLWLAPFMVTKVSSIHRDHPDWLLRDEHGRPIPVGITWEGVPYALDTSHPAVLEWLDKLIRKVRGWGYNYLKLDFLYAGAIPGKRYQDDIPREVAYRNAMEVMRAAAGDAYILACGAPIIPSLGLCDGIRVGPDVSPYWLNTPLTIWLNNPNDTSTQNSVRTSMHRLWLSSLVNIDPDVLFFRSRHNALKQNERQLLQDLGTITGFKATSDLPQWMNAQEIQSLRDFLESDIEVKKNARYKYQLDGREVDFSTAMPMYPHRNVPVWLAQNLGFLKIAKHQVLPAILESLKHNHEMNWLFYPLSTSL